MLLNLSEAFKLKLFRDLIMILTSTIAFFFRSNKIRVD
jgi:hypothetical protein